MSNDASKPAAAPSASKLPLVALLFGALNLGATGFVITRVARPAHAASSATVEEAPKSEEKKPETHLVALDPLLVNLNEPGSNRYLKATLEVEVTGDAVEELKSGSRVVRDGLLRYLSSLSVADTLGENAKDKIEQQIVSRVDTALGGKKRVRRLFFTEFMVQ